MPAAEFKTYPRKPHRGLTPIGCPGHLFEPDAVLFLTRLSRVSDELPADLADMHRLIYVGETFTKAGLLRCLRLRIGRNQANWIDGCIEMLAAEEEAAEKAKAPPQSDEEDHQL